MNDAAAFESGLSRPTQRLVDAHHVVGCLKSSCATGQARGSGYNPRVINRWRRLFFFSAGRRHLR